MLLRTIGNEELRWSRRAAAPIWIPRLPIRQDDPSTVGVASPECLRGIHSLAEGYSDGLVGRPLSALFEFCTSGHSQGIVSDGRNSNAFNSCDKGQNLVWHQIVDNAHFPIPGI